MTKSFSRKSYLLIGIIAFIVLILSLYIFVMVPRGKPIQSQEKILEILPDIVNDGDIICRLGDRLWSLYFRDLSFEDKRFSHMGVIRKVNDEITVIHAEGDTGSGKDYVQEASLEEFMGIARAIGIYRMKNIEGHIISREAQEFINLPFDWDFDIEDSSAIYCTELLYVILKRIAPDFELNTIYNSTFKKRFIPLESISDSDDFYEIYYISSKD